MIEDTLTVADLIAILSRVDPTLPVKMSMNQEYECEVDASMVGVREYDKGPVLYINDCLNAYVIDDTVYNNDGSIRAKYMDEAGDIRFVDTNEITTA